MVNVTDKNSNHELMRIISMFFIVLGHVLLFGGFLEQPNTSTGIIYNFIEFILIVHVNSYVLACGYYQSKSTFKQSRLWKIINSAWFYRILILIIFSLLGIISVGKVQILKDIAPISVDNYWFIKTYILLYCISPFLNKLINNIQKSTYDKLLLTGFLIFCIVSAISGGEFFHNSGYTLYSFIYLYFVGAYLKEYPLDKNYFFKIFTKELFQIIMVSLFFLCVLTNFGLYYFSQQIYSINSVLDIISNYIKTASLAYSNPIIVIQSIIYFSLFSTLTIKSKHINKIAGLMLGVYFIHENNYMRAHLYNWLGLVDCSKESLLNMGYMFLMTIAIFVGCSIIELIRQKIFKFIYDRKFATNIRKKYYAWLSKIHLIKV